MIRLDLWRLIRALFIFAHGARYPIYECGRHPAFLASLLCSIRAEKLMITRARHATITEGVSFLLIVAHFDRATQYSRGAGARTDRWAAYRIPACAGHEVH